MTVVVVVLYFIVLAVLSAYGLHRAHLVYLCWRNREKIDRVVELAPRLADDQLPTVTVQLPLFNESTVVVRLLNSIAALDYPREKLQIQVLDDSTDETVDLARAEVDKLCLAGFDAVHIHRTDRTGYKAGALDNGLHTAKGEFIAMFDADFVCGPDFLRALVGHFEDEKVACVQARWAHLNRNASILTRVQALMFDGHHLVENRARYGSGLLFNFSGTGGMWRRIAIEDAGGWQHDTVTEDLDLSYRAQMRGWKFIYRPDVVAPAELVEDISALRAQQHRWAKGTVQTAVKLLPRVLAEDSPLTIEQRIEATFHMTPHFTYPLMVMLNLLLLPVLGTIHVDDVQTLILVDMPVCMAPLGSLVTFYMLAESTQGRSRFGAIKMIPVLIALGAGLAPHLSMAVRDGLSAPGGEFVRTPKRGNKGGRYRATAGLPIAELALFGVSAWSAVIAIQSGHLLAFPFVTLFAIGYASVSFLMLRAYFSRPAAVRAVAPELPVISEDDLEMAHSGIRATKKGAVAGELAA